MKIQEKLLRERDREPIPNTTYGKPQYVAIKGDRQRIELSRGCPWGCDYCFEAKYTHAPTKDDVKQFPIPKIEKNYVEILDMNFLWQPNVLGRIRRLGGIKVDGRVVKYEEICGLDYRFLTQETADALKESRFVKPRIAWDAPLDEQYDLKDAIKMLKRAGYAPNDIMLFMIVNWEIPYEDCLKKLDLMKVWGVKVCDCCYDGGYKYAVPEYWTESELVSIRRRCRKHNQLVNFGIDPEADG